MVSGMLKITSLQHPLVKHLVKLRSDNDYRNEHQTLVLEGGKPIKEVANHIKKLIISESSPHFEEISAPEKIIVSEAVMKKISGMSSPEGVVAEINMPLYEDYHKWNYILVLDGINDPGNLGTLLRTALAFGWDGVFLLPNCCDPYNEKTIRAARGAHFKLPLAKGQAEDLEKLKCFQALVADLHGEDPQKLPLEGKRLLVLGNEAQGPGPLVRKFCRPVSLPMMGEMESLNVAVAGGILLYLLRKVNR
jgi:RNA methyltransferase, TrmH family